MKMSRNLPVCRHCSTACAISPPKNIFFAETMSVVRHAQQQVTRASQLGNQPGRLSNDLFLSGHAAPVTSARFSYDGRLLATCSTDRNILLWHIDAANLPALQLQNIAQFSAISNLVSRNGSSKKKRVPGAILDLDFSHDSKRLYACGVDMGVLCYDVTGISYELLHQLTAKTDADTNDKKLWILNALRVGQHQIDDEGTSFDLVIAAGDDAHAYVWDTRQPRRPIIQISLPTPITALEITPSLDTVFIGCIDNKIYVLSLAGVEYHTELTHEDADHVLSGHLDTVTDLRLSPHDGGKILMSTSMYNTCRLWDVQPYSPLDNRQLCVLEGARHGLDKNLIKSAWCSNGELVATGSGSSDCSVTVWQLRYSPDGMGMQGEIKYKLGGHTGSVTQVDFHPTHPRLIVSCSSDQKVILGEI